MSDTGSNADSNTSSNSGSNPREYKPSFLDSIEDVDDYQPGGLHPTNIGAATKYIYKVIHKLGFGGFSTVWLANNTQSAQNVALKIIRATQSDNCTELGILERLANIISDHPGKHHIASLLTSFNFDSPNGRHLCLVSEIAGPSISAIRSFVPNQRLALRADISRKISRQMAEALDFIHSQELCHADLRPSNDLLKIDSINKWSAEEIYERLKEPEEDEVIDPYCKLLLGNNHLRYVISPVRPPSAKFLVPDALLVDFGQAFPFDQPPLNEEIGIPYCYAASEVILGGKLGLFESWFGNQNESLSQMVQMIGKMPDSWWTAWEGKSHYFYDDGSPNEGNAKPWPLERMIADIGTDDYRTEEVEKHYGKFYEHPGTKVSEEEAAMFEDLVAGIFKWNPEERSSLKETLEHPWFSFRSAA